MKKKLIMFLLVMAALSMPVSAQEVMPDTCEESITAEAVPYVEDATLSFPVKYDTRSLGMTTSVKDQGDFPLCLTYARIAALETALIKKGYENNSVDLSEMHMLYERWLGSSTQKTFGQWCEYSGIQTYGLESSFDNSFQLCNFPVYEMQTPMVNLTDDYMPDASGAGSSPYEIKRIYLYSPSVDEKMAESVRATKEGIFRYGSVAANLSYVPGSEDDSAYTFFGTGKDYTYYLPEKKSTGVGHVIQIVGWDDSYSKSNFSNTPPADGAFLCKNSWGNIHDSSGYFWVSYYSQVRIMWEAFEVAKKGTTARGIETAVDEITLYAGQTSEPVTVKVIPATAEPVEWYIDIPENDDYLKVNADHSITCKKFQKNDISFAGDPDVSVRTIKIRTKDKSLNFSTQIKVRMKANTIQSGGTILIPDNAKADVTEGISVSPVAERKADIRYESGAGDRIEDGRYAIGTAYGQTSIRASLDGQSITIPCYVYCTGFDLGDDLDVSGYSNDFLKPQFCIEDGRDLLAGMIRYESSDESVARVEGDCIYFEGNGKALITGKLYDEKLTNGKELTDSIWITVRGKESSVFEYSSGQEPRINPPSEGTADRQPYDGQAETDPLQLSDTSQSTAAATEPVRQGKTKRPMMLYRQRL